MISVPFELIESSAALGFKFKKKKDGARREEATDTQDQMITVLIQV